MIDTFIQKKYFPVLLFLFALGLFVFNNGKISLYILDEAKNAECAREMLEQGEAFKPTFNYNLRTDKPPLHYFFMMASYSIFGVNEWPARFFSAVFGALTILVSFVYAKKFLNQKIAFYTAAILLASIHLNIQFRLAVPDPYLIFFFTWSIFLFYSALKTGKTLDKILLYVAIGLATLTKGPVAIGLAGLIFLIFLLVTKQFKWTIIRSLWPFLGVAIVLSIAVPWFIANGIQTNWEWTRDFFFKHNFQRFGSEMEGHGGIFLLTFLYVVIGLFPFSLFAVQAIGKTWKNMDNNFLVLCLITVAVVVVFFSVSQTKLPNYTVPAYPFLAILLARYLATMEPSAKSFRPILAGIFILALCLPVAGYYALRSDPDLMGISPKVWWLLILPAGVGVSIFISKRKEASLLVLASTFILGSLLVVGILFPLADQTNPVQKSLQLVQGREVACYKRFNPSYSFYLRKKIPLLQESGIDSFFIQNPGGVVISVKKEIDKIKLPDGCEIVFSARDLFEIPTTVLIEKKQ